MITKETFHELWAVHFKETVLFSHSLRNCFPDRWFRIHSLPESKRYANTDEEWKILLGRQNEIITELFGDGTPVLLITGSYRYGDPELVELSEEESALRSYSFLALDEIDLFLIDKENFEQGDRYLPRFAETVWYANGHNELLKSIADDELRAFFLSFEKNTIVAPYDGGVDFILKDSQTRDYFRSKYKAWLSGREDGL